MALESGARVGDYEIVGPLGSGGMSEVYRAKDLTLGREVAIKVLPPALARDPEKRARFEREAKLLAALNHKNIAVIHGLEQDGDVWYLILELIPGETLAERLKKGPLSLAEARAIFLQIAEALEAAHDKGIIHRDLKPANVMVTGQDSLRPGLLKVLDFGLAKKAAVDAIAADAETLQNITRPGAVLGTAPYMSPEQVRGETLDARSDVFSLASVLYEMATGRRAFDGADMSEILVAVLSRQPESVATLRPDLADLEPILEACWRKGVGERTRTASEILDDLRAAAIAPPPAPAEIDDTLAPSSHRPETPAAAARPQTSRSIGLSTGAASPARLCSSAYSSSRVSRRGSSTAVSRSSANRSSVQRSWSAAARDGTSTTDARRFHRDGPSRQPAIVC